MLSLTLCIGCTHCYIVIVFFLALYWALGHIAAIGLGGNLKLIDGSAWRTAIVDFGSILMRMCFVSALGMWPKTIKGDPSVIDDNGNRCNIIVSNHTSWMDVLVGMVVCSPLPGYVCKKEVADLPLIGFLSKVWDCALVDRNSKSGTSIIDQLRERADDPARQPIMIFPEGTTTNGTHLIHFHKGGFVPGAPVKPMIIRYPYKSFSPTFDSMDGKLHLFHLLTQCVSYCEVIFLPVYMPSEAEKADPALYAANVKRVMLAASAQGDSDVTYQDKKAYLAKIRGTDNKKQK